MTAAYDQEYESDFEPEPAAVKREGVSTTELAVVTETAASAVAARAEAIVQARHAVARKMPRNFDSVRQNVLEECKRPRFAEVARYRVPRGKKQNEEGQWVQNIIEGPSIRFVETATRLMGNFEVEVTTIYDDPVKRILSIVAIDYESNASWSNEITIEKSVERKKLGKGQKALRVRTNSYGDTVFVVPATDDDVVMKQAAAVSKAARTLSLRLIPADLVDEAMDLCIRTLKDKDAKDPGAARKELVDKFAALGVKAVDLVDYLGGRSLDTMSPEQLLELRIIGASMKQGEATWAEYLAASPYREQPASEPAATGEPAKKAEALRKQVEQKKREAAAKKAAKAAAPQPKVTHDASTGEVAPEDEPADPDSDGR